MQMLPGVCTCCHANVPHVYEFDHTCVSPQGGGSDADSSRCFFMCHVTEPRIDEDQSNIYIHTHTYMKVVVAMRRPQVLPPASHVHESQIDESYLCVI